MESEKITVWILGDQLLDPHPILSNLDQMKAKDICVLLIESQGRIQKLPYHRKKLVLLLSAMRHYGNLLESLGVRVDYQKTGSFEEGLVNHVSSWKPDRLITMAASEFQARKFQVEKLQTVINIPVEVVQNQQFLSEVYNPIPETKPGKRYVMENFYRRMRKHFGVLVDSENNPTGGSWNYDKLNRKSLPKGIEIPKTLVFQPDAITVEVMQEVNRIDHAVGTSEGFNLAVTHQEAKDSFTDFVKNRLKHFGPYEDAMSSKEPILFHSVLSPYLNIGLLEPMALIQAVEAAYNAEGIPINSAEGFIRQVLGWREYIYWQYWRLMPELQDANEWRSSRNMPTILWDGETNLNCVHHLVQRLTSTGYTHHIERLMVITNFCLLAGVNPKQVADWFLSFYIDAYEWVVLPNVIGMGLNADGGQTATKPYIASANYINRMSDYCHDCTYRPKQRSGEGACPFNTLYWNFLIQNEEVLRANPRMGPNVLSLRHIKAAERSQIQAEAKSFFKLWRDYEP